ncbi:hypothetical protein FHS04_002818 [Mesoflavibacter sabulilitoris]|uniref:Uncharacterized protein n=1 Tax=Mesoflavibacter zeaxanthinifaciens subsp. sabulilitoris TaxID=1520893 RepID=A0A2T1NNP2_9FLAO|nr:hypothetical protein [Mesoflavibacter zeaxanthinifaciens subsp. sabulilitoris]PSG94510.1 hypothetical protein C7H61_00825 [Mesoflavibacter zeaxanthinifaciens subsp. sabulilitoris]
MTHQFLNLEEIIRQDHFVIMMVLMLFFVRRLKRLSGLPTLFVVIGLAFIPFMRIMIPYICFLEAFLIVYTVLKRLRVV